ncbi:MAG: ABC transporter substrate-binding protein [Actinomycetia bacterium]|nr:ABC transporter substrate-binding protein [Actinomycetes bacterium]
MPCSRRGLLAGALLALAGCGTATGPGGTASPGAGASGTAAPGSAKKPVIGLTYIPNIQFAPFYWGVAKQLYQPEVELRHHGEREGLFTALLTGQEQLVVAGGDEMLAARAESDADLVTVATLYRTHPVRAIVLQDSPVTSFADLKGRKVGLPGRYGENWFALRLGLAKAGLGESDVEIVDIGYTQQAALVTKKVDAVMGFVNGDAVQLSESGNPVRSLSPGDLPLVSASLVTTGAYAQANRELVAAVAKGTVAGMRGVVEKPDEAVELARAYVPALTEAGAATYARAVLRETATLYQDADRQISGTVDTARWDEMSKTLHQAGLIKKDVPASQSVWQG